MEKISGVYKITSPSEKVYIGSSIDVYNRLCSYKGYKCKTQTRLYNSIKKYGWDRHLFEIIDRCSVDELLQKELYYGTMYNVLDRHCGLNCRLPKSTDGYVYMSQETKDKISASNAISQIGSNKGYYESKLKKLTKEQVISIKEMLIQNKLTQKEIAYLFGVSRKIISRIVTGKSYSSVGKYIDMSIRKKKYVKLTENDYDSVFVLIKSGMSQSAVAKKLCVNQSHISRILSNERYLKTYKRKESV